MKRLPKLISLLLVPLLLGCIAVLLLLATEPGTRWLLQRGVALMQGQLQIGAVHGNALGPLRLDDVSYRTEDGTLTLQRLAFDWRPLALLYDTLDISVIKTQGLRWRHSPRKSPAPLTVLPEINLPLRILIRHAEAQDNDLMIGTRHVPIEQLLLSATGNQRGLQITRLQIDTAETHVELNGSLQPRGGYPMQLELRWLPGTSATYPLQGSVKLTGTIKELHLALNQTGPFPLTLDATLHELLSRTPRVDMTGQWRDARWPLQNTAQYTSPRGELQLHGALDDYTLTLNAALQGVDIPAGEWSGTGHGNSRSITWKPLHGDTLDGKLDITGRLTWSPTLSWDTQLSGRTLNPGLQWPEWPGRISFDIDSKGSLKPPHDLTGLAAELHINSLTGQLRGQPVAARGELAYDTDTLRITDVTLDSGTAHLTAAGTLDKDWHLDWAIEAPQLDHLVPQARGAVTGKGTLRGPRAQPFITAQVDSTRLGYDRQIISTLHAQMALDLADERPSSIALQLTDISSAGRPIGTLQVNADGRLREHTLTAKLANPHAQGMLQLVGAWDGKRWQGRLQQAEAHDTTERKSLGQWTLSAPAPMSVTPLPGDATAAHAADLAETCLHDGDARICFTAHWTPADWRVDARLEHITLQLFSAFLPPDMELKGTLDGSLNARGGGTRDTSAQLQLTAAPGTLDYRNSQDEVMQVAYEQGSLSAKLEKRTLTGSAQLRLAKQGQLHADLKIAPFDSATPAKNRLQGSLRGELTELGLLAAFLPATEETRGRLSVDLDITGTQAQPRLTGQVTLSEAGAFLPQIGMRLEAVQLALRADGGPQLAVTGQANSGKGTLQVTGNVEMDAAQGFPAHLSITGKNFEVVNLPDYQAVASPDLTLLLHDRTIDVTGTLEIPVASITVRKLPERAVAVSTDEIIVGMPETTQAGWMINAQVGLSLGDKVRFSGFNLESRVTGKLQIEEHTGTPAKAQGELNLVDGTYNAYGRKLTITRGRLIFDGLLDNPRLDARAVRKVGTVTAGIRAAGPLKTPDLTVYAEPAMDQGDALAYLLLGRPLSQASGSEGQMLQQASGSLGLSGGLFLARQIGSKLGLEDVQIEDDATGTDASLVVGKYLSPKLYISYGIGLFTPENLLRLRYQFNSWLTLQTESGTQSGADLLYTKEYD